jgi:hypothetical protein
MRAKVLLSNGKNLGESCATSLKNKEELRRQGAEIENHSRDFSKEVQLPQSTDGDLEHWGPVRIGYRVGFSPQRLAVLRKAREITPRARIGRIKTGALNSCFELARPQTQRAEMTLSPAGSEIGRQDFKPASRTRINHESKKSGFFGRSESSFNLLHGWITTRGDRFTLRCR